jgi:hypothetical protein
MGMTGRMRMMMTEMMKGLRERVGEGDDAELVGT